jgi:predicted amidohydrolase YtcJ
MLRRARIACLVTLTLTVLLVLAGCGAGADAADLVLLHGKLVTMDDSMPLARALAARDGRIVAVGSDDEIEAYVGPDTEVIDLEERLAIPGFIEGHAHFTGLGQSLMNLRLGDAETWEEVVATVGEAVRAAAPGQWIVGRGWHQDKWAHTPTGAVEGYPLHHRLSEVAPDNPVWLRHASGHASIANAKAMELAGIERGTADPPGGHILRDASGEPTGVLRETASGLVGRAYQVAQQGRSAEELRAEQRRAVELAAGECLSKGVTSFQDAGSSFETVDLLREMADAGELDLRLWVMLRVGNDDLEARIADYRLIDHADHRLTVRAIKRSLDGALGSHGAWLLEPYVDLPDSSGLNTLPLDDLERTAQIAVENDFQLCVHAIGDRANRETLDLFQQTFEAHADKSDLRWRVEHAQHLHPDDIPRFAELGVIASMQGVHCTSDGPWVPDRLGMQRSEEGAYVWRSLWDSRAVVTNGTDAPVEDVDPIQSFYATVSRRMADGEVFFPEQKLSRDKALRSYTINAAHAAFEEQSKGSLSPGKLADIVVLSQDIMTIAEEAIPDTQVLYTIVGGEVVYRR